MEKSKYYDKKLYYKGYYHNRAQNDIGYGPTEVIWDEDTHQYIIRQKHGMATGCNLVAITDQDEFNIWHRKRKSKYAVWIDEDTVPSLVGYGYGSVYHFDTETVTPILIPNPNSSAASNTIGAHFIGIVDGVTYYETRVSPKFKSNTLDHYIAKSIDGLYMETICRVEYDTFNSGRRFKACSPYKSLILEEQETIEYETGSSTLIKNSSYSYLKFDTTNTENPSVERINLSSKIPNNEIITMLNFPFVYTTNKDVVHFRSSGGTNYEFKNNKTFVALKVYFITDKDTLIDITEDVKPNDFTYYTIEYKTNEMSSDDPYITINYPFRYQGLSDLLQYLNYIYSYPDKSENYSTTLCNGDFFLFGFTYRIKISSIQDTMLDAPYANKTIKEVLEEVLEVEISQFRFETYTNTHNFSINKKGEITQIKYFESNDKINIIPKYSFTYRTSDRNYFYYACIIRSVWNTYNWIVILKCNYNFSDVISYSVEGDVNKTKRIIYEFGKNNEDTPIENPGIIFSDKKIPVYENGIFKDVIWGYKDTSGPYSNYSGKYLIEKYDLVKQDDIIKQFCSFDSAQICKHFDPSYGIVDKNDDTRYCGIYISDRNIQERTWNNLSDVLHEIE